VIGRPIPQKLDIDELEELGGVILAYLGLHYTFPTHREHVALLEA